jgi:hypothetical protein
MEAPFEKVAALMELAESDRKADRQKLLRELHALTDSELGRIRAGLYYLTEYTEQEAGARAEDRGYGT